MLCLGALLAGAVTAAVALHGDELRAAPGRAIERVREAPRKAVERVRTGGVRAVRCPASADPTCRAVRGRVVLVEAVDPDGDGDLHVVVADGSITAPGLTSVDVRPGLRPGRDPQVGDVVSAAGPVQRGSFGQDQIHALRFRAG